MGLPGLKKELDRSKDLLPIVALVPGLIRLLGMFIEFKQSGRYTGQVEHYLRRFMGAWVGRSKADMSSKTSYKRPTWVDIALSTDDIVEIQARADNQEALFEGLTSMVAEGYKFTFGWDTESKALVMHCYGAPKSKNEGLVLTSRARSPEKVLASTLHKHEVITKGVWQPNGDDLGADFIS